TIVGCDRVTKHLATTHLAGTPARSYLAGTIRVEYAENAGAFLGLGARWPRWARTAAFTIGTSIVLTAAAIAAIRLRWTGGRFVASDLRAGPGVLGLLGPNGPGRPPLMRILATVTRPATGPVTWNGADLATEPDTLRAVLGYLPQDFGIYPNLTAVEFLEYLA